MSILLFLFAKKKTERNSLENACDAIDQGIDLGLRSIVYLGGGEPLLYKHFWPFIEYVSSKKVIPVIFTNGTLINLSVAKRLFDLGASIMIKLDGGEKIQDQLSGPGTYKQIRASLDALLEAGFENLNGRYTRLGIGPCATKVNLSEIPEIWRFARKNNFFPNVELATEIGAATLDITPDCNQTRWLRQTLKEIDEKEFNIKWSTPYSSTPAHSCGIFLAGAAVKVDRGVALCPEMPSVANLSNKTLAEIIKEPPFSEARALEDNIQEPCASCKFFRLCLGGCRSKALVINKSIFACDPHCTLLTENRKNLHE
jgi:radical SAM protein with 4Fe4S-binding SPASM domain